MNLSVNCEVEIMLPPEMTIQESFGIVLSITEKLENMDQIARAFVHVSVRCY